MTTAPSITALLVAEKAIERLLSPSIFDDSEWAEVKRKTLTESHNWPDETKKNVVKELLKE
jgi:hypothetical protein